MSSVFTDFDEDDGPILPRRPMEQDTELDLAPMIDVTFLLLIFFLVTSVSSASHALRLPPATHGVGIASPSSVTITLVARGDRLPAVYLEDGAIGQPLSDDLEAQQSAVRAAVEAGLQRGARNVILKAERDVAHREVARIGRIVSEIEGVQLNLAVKESD